VKAAVGIPVIANGDIDSPERAREVLAATGADGLMIGRAAQGRPWIFREIMHFLEHGAVLPPPTVAEAHAAIGAHLADHYAFYGEGAGARIARKHLGWYTRDLAGGDAFRQEINAAETAKEQLCAVDRFFDKLAREGERLAYRARIAEVVDARAAFARAAHTSLRGGEALAA
jgi:tRNA-dihydrouridine synthase B